MGRRPSGRRHRPTKRCSQASMPLYVPGLPPLPECAAASSLPICSADCWLLPPPVHVKSSQSHRWCACLSCGLLSSSMAMSMQ